MPDTPEIRSAIEAAEGAAAAGDHASAEALLRKAALLQESTLGPLHPDLANTLNNLGVACEIAGKLDEAERCYRRACAIADSALPADHPFVATSRRNLEQFCAARGKAVDAQPETPRPVVAREPPGSLAAAAVVAGLLVTFAAIITWYSTSGDVEPRPASPSASTPASVAAEKPTPKGATPAPRGGGAVKAPRAAPPVRESPAPRTPTAGALVLVEARLCKELSTVGAGEWRCVPPGDPVDPGPLVFYTRIKSSIDTTVEHRWYYGRSRLHVAELRIHANMGSGYRTYSRNTIGRERSGNWRVELRTEAGELLHEERFVVR